VVAVSLPAATVEFNRDVRPILSDKCFACHGPDAKAKGIPLRLDEEAAAKNGRAIVPGNAAGSELMKRVTAAKPALRMPPAATGHQLTAAEIRTLETWINEGAAWQKHWAYLKPVRVAPPGGAGGHPASVHPASVHPIDAFVTAALRRQQLTPAAEASRETLIRRVSLDLTGLPPTTAEVDAFLADQSPNAYEKLVDRLLASPRYGERMAARWLDAARYADTNGYQFDGERQMWRWRDWVIDAFNRNLPYNQFALEQLAGDMLPNRTPAQIIATGFNRNHRGNTEDGIIADEYRVEYVVDRVETTSAVFLGLTMGCARCHNHKYDPLSQREFYQFFAYFNNVPENGRAMKYGNSPPYVAAPTDGEARQLAKLEADLAQVDGVIARAVVPAGTRAGAWVPRASLDWEGGPVADPKTAFYDIRDHFTLAARFPAREGVILAKKGTKLEDKGYGALVREDKLFVHFTSSWDTDALKLESVEKLTPGREYHLAVTYDGSVAAAGFRVYLDGQPIEMKVLQDNLYRPLVNAGGIFKQLLRAGANVQQGRAYGRVLTARELAALAHPGDARFNKEAWLETAATGEPAAAWRQRNALIAARDRLQRSLPTVMVMDELAPRRDTFILSRGQYDKPGDKVEPGLPAVLPPLPAGAPNNRLGLAQWVIDPENPLTARVAVNRFWQHYFGTGFVKTVEDFGQQGEWPTHPELLDWLATEFIRTGWDMKAMQKLIVTSATYKQSSKATAELTQRDPENRWLARGPRMRLPAEAVRDNALAVAGLLREKLGGPSVKPYQPDGLWKEVVMQDMDYQRAGGDDLYRRSLYTFWKRTVAPPMMANFDAANRETCVVRENRTNTPLQALNLMNDVTFVEAARVLAEKMMRAGPAPDERLRQGFRMATARWPSSREQEVLGASLRYHLDYFATGEKQAAQFIAQGETPVDAALKPRELAAYAAVASLILNLDEVVTKE